MCLTHSRKIVKLNTHIHVYVGDRDEIKAAMAMILEKLAGDPQSSSYPTLNYASSHPKYVAAVVTGNS